MDKEKQLDCETELEYAFWLNVWNERWNIRKLTHKCILRQELYTDASEWKKAQRFNFQFSFEDTVKESYRQPVEEPSESKKRQNILLHTNILIIQIFIQTPANITGLNIMKEVTRAEMYTRCIF